MSFTLVREMGLEPTHQYWPGHLGLALSDCGTSSASTKSKISCDSGALVLNDSDLLICLDIKNKGHSKTNVLYTGAGNGTWTHTPILTQAPQACLVCPRKQVSSTTKSSISCDSSVLALNDSDLLRYKNKGHSKNECPLHWCGKWDLNPHANTDTSTSSLPVCRFQHPRKSAYLL